MLLLLEAQEGNWDELDLMVRAFQRATMALKYADVPVVVAPAGLRSAAAARSACTATACRPRRRPTWASSKSGVGLIPAGGGTKEMLARAMAGAAGDRDDPLPHVQRVFETIGFAQGLDQRGRRAAARLSAATRTRSR